MEYFNGLLTDLVRASLRHAWLFPLGIDVARLRRRPPAAADAGVQSMPGPGLLLDRVLAPNHGMPNSATTTSVRR
jgi:hypothetical protein